MVAFGDFGVVDFGAVGRAEGGEGEPDGAGAGGDVGDGASGDSDGGWRLGLGVGEGGEFGLVF